jgi:hypothetical protein
MVTDNAPLTPAGDGVITNGRDNQGRFCAGNRYGQGNPHARRVQRLKSRLLAAVKPDSMTRIVQRLVAMAESGDLEAIKILFAYTLGRPPQAVALTTFLAPADLDPASGASLRARAAEELMEWQLEQKQRLQQLLEMPPLGPSGPTDQSAE